MEFLTIDCKDCKDTVIDVSGKKQHKDGVYISEHYHSPIVCTDCLEAYDHCQKCDEWNFTEHIHKC
jgi:hypothetical protein